MELTTSTTVTLTQDEKKLFNEINKKFINDITYINSNKYLIKNSFTYYYDSTDASLNDIKSYDSQYSTYFNKYFTTNVIFNPDDDIIIYNLICNKMFDAIKIYYKNNNYLNDIIILIYQTIYNKFLQKFNNKYLNEINYNITITD